MASPSPVPSPSVLVVKNGSKMRSKRSGGMPGPVSRIASSTVPSGLTVAVTLTRPTPRIACAALRSVLKITCWSCPGRASTSAPGALR